LSITEAAVEVLNRRGRKRKSSRRMAGNRSPRDSVADILSVVKAQRVKLGIPAEKATDYRHGYTLGRLHWQGDITDEQFNAGEKYLSCVVINAKLHGIPCPHPRAVDLLAVGMGLSCEREPDQEWIDAQLRRVRDCRRALLDCGKELLLGSAINRVVYGVVVENWPLYVLERGDFAPNKGNTLQNLRCGLNALESVFG
jgi:hypothetical protein